MVLRKFWPTFGFGPNAMIGATFWPSSSYTGYILLKLEEK